MQANQHLHYNDFCRYFCNTVINLQPKINVMFNDALFCCKQVISPQGTKL